MPDPLAVLCSRCGMSTDLMPLHTQNLFEVCDARVGLHFALAPPAPLRL